MYPLTDNYLGIAVSAPSHSYTEYSHQPDSRLSNNDPAPETVLTSANSDPAIRYSVRKRVGG